MGLAAAAIASALAAPLTIAAAVVALLLIAIFQVRRRARRKELPAPAPALAIRPAGLMVCPSCMREFPSGTTYCAIDARKLLPAEETGERRSPGMRCPRCRRAFEGGTKYCPIDAEELVPQAIWEATHGQEPEHDHSDHDGGSDGKICPVCAAKYGIEASFCGKDGSELVTVN